MGRYAKAPFGGAEHVLDYLARYTHRVAISNSRLVAMTPETVTFHYRDSRHHDQRKLMTLTHEEFLRRLLLHVLPTGFQRIRHYGFLEQRPPPGGAACTLSTPLRRGRLLLSCR